VSTEHGGSVISELGGCGQVEAGIAERSSLTLLPVATITLARMSPLSLLPDSRWSLLETQC
jgi:hypothetical protein